MTVDLKHWNVSSLSKHTLLRLQLMLHHSGISMEPNER